MASYIFPRNDSKYRVRVYKLPVSSPLNKTDQNQSDFNYEVVLPETINDVIGFKLIDWSLPRDIIPSFWPTTTKLAGVNKLDFRLSNLDISPVPADFTITFPTKFYAYQNYKDPTRDYVQMTATLMNQAIASNPTWQNKVNIDLVPITTIGTLILVSTLDASLPTGSLTYLTLLFQSGPNKAESVYYQMGWDTPVDAVSSTSVYILPPGVTALQSPNAVQLRGANYLDIFVEESNQRPMQRIFFKDDAYTTNRLNITESVYRFEVDQKQPPRKLERLHIKLRYEEDTDPGDFVDGPILFPMYFTFHFFTVDQSVTDMPDWLHQNLSY